MRNAPSRLAVLLALAVSLLPLAPALAQPALADPSAEANDVGGMSTIAVVGVSSYDGLMGDIGYLGGLMGNPESAEMIEGMIALFTQGRGIVGLDKLKPWGVVLQTDGMKFDPIVCLPINELDAILELLINFQIQSEDLGNGVFEITAPNQILYAKQNGEWVYVGQSEAALDSAPADPTPVLAALVADYDIGARLLVQNVPPMFKQMAIGGLRSGFEQSLQQGLEESDEDFAKRREFNELQIQQIVDLINDLDELTIGWAIDGEGGKSYLDMIGTAVEGSKAAEQFASFKGGETNFAGFLAPDASVLIRACGKLSPEAAAEQAKQVEAMLPQMKEQVFREIDKNANLDAVTADTLKEALGKLLEAYMATIASGDADGAFAANISDTEFSAIGGAKAKETGKIESALRTLDELGKAKGGPAYPGIAWDADSYAGASFHTLALPIPPNNPEANELFGAELKVAVGLGPEVVYLAVGEDSMEALKASIDASASAGPTSMRPMEMTVSLGKLMQFAKKVDQGENSAVTTMIADLLADANGQDHLRLTAEALPAGVRYRLEAEEGVLKAIGAAAAAAQQAQMQQRGF